MTLKEEAQKILENFEQISSEEFIQVTEKIKTSLQSQLTSEYLTGKISKIIEITDETEKKNLCKALKPYLDWYIQGN
jgi:hypothetical protein